MSASKGTTLAIKVDGVRVAGVRTRSVAINNEPIDITTDDDNGFRRMLAEPGEKQIDLAVSGITDNDDFRAAAVSGDPLIEDVTIEYGDGSIISGDFYLASYTENGEYNDAVQFDATLNSSGSFTYTGPTT